MKFRRNEELIDDCRSKKSTNNFCPDCWAVNCRRSFVYYCTHKEEIANQILKNWLARGKVCPQPVVDIYKRYPLDLSDVLVKHISIKIVCED